MPGSSTKLGKAFDLSSEVSNLPQANSRHPTASVHPDLPASGAPWYAISTTEVLMSARTYTQTALGLFVVLGVVDFVLTYILVEGIDAYESNPIASMWLQHHGWHGLALFK